MVLTPVLSNEFTTVISNDCMLVMERPRDGYGEVMLTFPMLPSIRYASLLRQIKSRLLSLDVAASDLD